MKLVILSEGMTGRSCELVADKTTLGRLEDNTYQIMDPSVSAHHCEVLQRGQEVVIRDLDSTNGTYINGEEVSERAIKPGQILRLGQIELRLETDARAAQARERFDATVRIPGGVSRTDLELAHDPSRLVHKGTGFTKKTNTVTEMFVIIAIALGVIVIALLLYVSSTIHQ